jgi:hypothetical protein
MTKANQSQEMKQFYLDRAAAKRARRYETPMSVSTNEVAHSPKSRQVERAEFRVEVSRGELAAKLKARTSAQSALLTRQTEREKAGVYSGRGVRGSVSPSRSRLNTRTVKKGAAFARIITKYTVAGRELSLHATKGWRSHRA